MANTTPLLSAQAKHDGTKNETSEQSSDSIKDATIVWFDQYMDDVAKQKETERMKSLLREINDYVEFFSQPDSCIDYVKSAPKEKIFLITTGSYASELLEKIHDLQQIDSVFIFCAYRPKYLPLKEKYPKIIDVFTESKYLKEPLRNKIDLVAKPTTVFGLLDGKQRSTRYLTRESASFLWFQLLTDVLKNIVLTDMKNTGIEEMLTHCQSYYRGDQEELNNIEDFRKKYKPEDAIFWYSKDSFVYRLVNKALRTEDIDALYTFRVYITHLRAQIAHEHDTLRQISCNAKSNIIRSYRGFKMTKGEINQWRDNVGGIISMNGFFSSSYDIEEAVKFALKESKRDDVVGVLLEVEGDINLHKMIFADITKFSDFPEEQEVLFDLATIFKIVHVEFDEGKNLWVMKLSGVEKSSHTVNEYIKSVNKETKESNSTLLLSQLMYDMGEYDKSEKYLKCLLKNSPSDHNDVSKIYFHLGRVYCLRRKYREALDYFEKAIKLQKREVAPKQDSFDIARTLHNMANVYLHQRQIAKAIDCYEEALEMKRSILIDNPNHPSIATTLAAIGSAHYRNKDLRAALKSCKESYEMKTLSLVNDHPSLADSLHSLGLIYEETEDYEEALDYFLQALEIKQKTLPATHPSISATLDNMGIVYAKLGEYDKALVCYNQALEIEKTTLPSDDLNRADTFDNLYTLYSEKFEHDKAVEIAHCRLQLRRRSYDDKSDQ